MSEPLRPLLHQIVLSANFFLSDLKYTAAMDVRSAYAQWAFVDPSAPLFLFG